MTYISGKITGLDLHVSRLNFEFAQIKLAPNKTIHPFEIKPLFGKSKWINHMISDVIILIKCDSIYFLSNWNNSRGARIEMFFAKLLKKKIYYE